MIKIIEKSLCGTCEHQQICVLTTNKKSVYNCSEYDYTLSEDLSIKKENKRELVLN
ncbi:hypothetical protein M4I21_11185 [Cellulophaga sp. 20_2_10]|uniref:hypothetical protein n=1 Tax=Cellulophaga sp. 20_2_10 TaxID=2942476 RepID=UPI00201A99E2|nr:hypothetical protein [Cellulophaga sp. 20_2_10]MCL5246376.1 hypothetical protein [Cellulophaga sp. 20_2_10]